jgi:hypothetical protein
MYNQHLCRHFPPYHTEALISTDGLTFDSRDDEEYSDPVTLDTIQDPVVVVGAKPMMVYEKKSINKWLSQGNTDPLTRVSYGSNFQLKPVIDLNPNRIYSQYSSFHDRIDSFIQFVKNKYNHTFIYQKSTNWITQNTRLTISIPDEFANSLFSKLIVTFDAQRNRYKVKHMHWSKTYPGNRIPYWEANDDRWSGEGQEVEFNNLSNLFEYIDNHIQNTLEEIRNPRVVPCIIPVNPAIRIERERLERQERLNQRQREFTQTDIFENVSSKRSKKKKVNN